MPGLTFHYGPAGDSLVGGEAETTIQDRAGEAIAWMVGLSPLDPETGKPEIEAAAVGLVPGLSFHYGPAGDRLVGGEAETAIQDRAGEVIAGKFW